MIRFADTGAAGWVCRDRLWSRWCKGDAEPGFRQCNEPREVW